MDEMKQFMDGHDYFDMMNAISNIKEKMADEESLKLYALRLKYLIDRDFHANARKGLELDKNWYIPQLERRFPSGQEKYEIVIWGYSPEAEYIRVLIEHSNYAESQIYYCDHNPSLWETSISDIVVLSPSEVVSEHKDAIVIIAPKAIYMDVLVRLGNMFFSTKNVIIPEGMYAHHLYGIRGWQYFDFWEPQEHEVFLDAGALNGQTTVEFAKWCDGKYEGVYLFEANPNMLNACKENIDHNHIRNAEVFLKAAWNEKTMLSFCVDEGIYPSGSKVTDVGANMYVEADTIDNCLQGRRVSLIKMDIEGSEFMALEGAWKTIEKYKPRLAISLYHRPEDVIEISYIINCIRTDYKFAIRQYASNMAETVLYAF